MDFTKFLCSQKIFAIVALVSIFFSVHAVTFTGVILDSAMGSPLAGVKVSAGPDSYRNSFLFDDTTDDSGRFSLRIDTTEGIWLIFSSDKSKFKVQITKKNYFTKLFTVAFPLNDTTICDTISLTQCYQGSIGGTITVQGTTNEIIGAKVKLYIGKWIPFNPVIELIKAHWDFSQLSDTTITDSGGHFRFNNLFIDTPAYAISVAAPSCISQFLGPIHLERDQLLQSDFHLIDTTIFGKCTGVIKDSISGEPIYGANVKLLCTDTSVSQQIINTKSDGYYSFWILPRYNYNIMVNKYNCFTKSQSDISIPENTTVKYDFFLKQIPLAPALVKCTPDPTNDKTPSLCWNVVNNASDYKIIIDDDHSFTTPIVSQKTGDITCFIINSELPVGKFYWHVSSSLDFNLFSEIDSFTVTDGPSDLALNKSYIELGAQTNSIVGLLSTVGPMPASEYRYSLVAGDGDIDNARFYIRSDTLITATTIDSTNRYFFHLRIRTTDKQNWYYEKPVAISIGQNIAFHKLTTASGIYTANTADKAVDGDTLNGWGVNQKSGAWIKVDFQGTYTIRNFKMKINQTPDANTIFEVYGYTPTGDSSIIHTFSGYTVKDQWLDVNFDLPISGQKAIKVLARDTPCWVALYEIIVMGSPDIIPTANEIAAKKMRQIHEFSIKTVPFSSNRTMLINLPDDSRIRIITSTGRIVQDFGYLKQGQHLLEFKNQNIAYGCFFIEAKMAHECKIKKIVILH